MMVALRALKCEGLAEQNGRTARLPAKKQRKA